MVVKIMLNTPLCDHMHLIRAEKINDQIELEVNSSCDSIESLTKSIDNRISTDNLMAERESNFKRLMEKPAPQCFVPSAIATACWIEKGLISKSLAKEVGSVNMEFVEIE